MIVSILTIIFAAIMIGVGIFSLTHQHRPFLVFHPESIPAFSKVLRFFGVVFIGFGLLCLVSLFLNSDQLLFWVLIIGCFLVIGFQITIAQFFGKK